MSIRDNPNEEFSLPNPETTTFRGFLEDERCRFRALSTEGVRIVTRLTYRCDLACPHCLVGSRTAGVELGYNDWNRVFAELPEINAKKVLLTGGEPLLHPDLVGIVRTISQMGIPVDLNSNLQRMTKLLMRDLHRAGLTEISVSLEGLEEIHDTMHGKRGTFSKMVQAIRWAGEMGIKVDASCCLTTDNYHSLHESFAILKTLPIQSFTISRLFPIGHGMSAIRQEIPQQQLTTIYDDFMRNWIPHTELPIRLVGLLNCPEPDDCERGKSLIGITPSGEVVACVLTADNPKGIPHPLKIGLKQSVAQLRKKLSERNYKLCCDQDV